MGGVLDPVLTPELQTKTTSDADLCTLLFATIIPIAQLLFCKTS